MDGCTDRQMDGGMETVTIYRFTFRWGDKNDQIVPISRNLSPRNVKITIPLYLLGTNVHKISFFIGTKAGF